MAPFPRLPWGLDPEPARVGSSGGPGGTGVMMGSVGVMTWGPGTAAEGVGLGTGAEGLGLGAAAVVEAAAGGVLVVAGTGAVVLDTMGSGPDVDLNEEWFDALNDAQRSYLEALEAHPDTPPVAMAINGEKLDGETRQLAIHLARLLRLSDVGGMPPNEPPDPGHDNDRHWWHCIKTYLKNIQSALKDGSRKQALRELLKRGFTEEQIVEIERRLAEAAGQMGEDAPPFLPPP
jgi:hypothetical protein